MLKSPLKTRPFRNPGQSLDEELANLLDDRVIPYFVCASALFVLALMEWLGYLTSSPRHPILFTILAGGSIGFLIVRVLQLRRRAWNLRLGRDGERLVGQSLEELRLVGAEVFHDVLGDGFNLDHVVISDRGVFVIETKTRSKPKTGGKVTFDQKAIRDTRRGSVSRVVGGSSAGKHQARRVGTRTEGIPKVPST
jgi:hypothetical protein